MHAWKVSLKWDASEGFCGHLFRGLGSFTIRSPRNYFAMILLCEESARSLDWIIVSYYKKVVKKHQHANLTLPKWGQS